MNNNTSIRDVLESIAENEGKEGHLKIKILKSLFELKEASIANLCDNMNLSIPSVNKILSGLFGANWIERKGNGISKNGRRPSIISLAPNLFYILCIDIELFAVKIAIFDNTVLCFKKITFPFILSKSREDISTIVAEAEKLLTEAQIDKKQLIGVSICLPGLINTVNGETFFYLTEPANRITLSEYFEALFGLPVILQNDVNAAALGELKYGKAQGKKDALVLLMDWGIGLGIIMDGDVRKGALGFSGEIGHIPFDYNGKLCYCGKQGCLETIASGIALVKMAKEGIKSGQSSILYELSNQNLDNIDPAIIIDAAKKGDLFAIQLLSQVGSALGKGISTLIQIFNPELIILEGRIAGAGQYITLPVLQSINTYCMAQIREQTQIAVSELGESASLIGCAIEGINKLLPEC
ncbi:ROK family protein [Parafilimonas sp.]|uniref:ROK family protein n=1 Tax=Parafilimonas sp. TaxID=1969739 RepID=UPI0039E4122A